MTNAVDRKVLYWKLAAFFFLFQMTWSAGYSLFALWLGQGIKLDGAYIGFVFSVNAFVAMCTKAIYGYMLDKLGMKKNILWLVCGLTLFIGPFFIYVYHPLLKSNFWLGVTVGGLYLGMSYLAGIAAIESYVEKCGRRYDLEYGQIRMWGSLGWAVSTFYAGRIFNIDPNINFWIASGLAILVMFAMMSIKVDHAIEEQAKTPKVTGKDVGKLFTLPHFWMFLLYVAGVAWMYFVVEQQFPRYYVTFFPTKAEGTAMFGYLNSLQIFLEAGAMFCAPFLINKIGPKRGLILAGLVCTIRLVGSGMLAHDPITISAFKLLHAVELPILLVSVFKYIAAHFDSRLASTMYLMGYQCFMYLGIVVVGPLAGKLYDVHGFAPVYNVMGLIALAFTVVSCFTLKGDIREAKLVPQPAAS